MAFILNKHFPKIQKSESPEDDCLENQGTSSSKIFGCISLFLLAWVVEIVNPKAQKQSPRVVL